jgi:hypothetical protein
VSHSTATQSRRRPTTASREVRASLCVGADDASHTEICGAIATATCLVSVRVGSVTRHATELYRLGTLLFSIYSLTRFSEDEPYWIDPARRRVWSCGRECDGVTASVMLDAVDQLLDEVRRAADDEIERDADRQFRDEYEAWLDETAADLDDDAAEEAAARWLDLCG